jgi:excisionase family DNA binding protein
LNGGAIVSQNTFIIYVALAIGRPIRQNYAMASDDPSTSSEPYTTIEVASLLGLAVRSVQLMVYRGELDAWKTPGGHRRISRASVERWLAERRGGARPADAGAGRAAGKRAQRVLLIEDSVHFQNLVRLLVGQKFPQVELHVADEGFVGLAMAGQLQPDVLIVDILLPGIDGATLITSLRSHPQFRQSRLIVITSLDESQREPYAFALAGVPVVHKPNLVAELPSLLAEALGTLAAPAPSPAS